ncbi:MAG TPA: hypothetical protein VHZ55_13340, partial [Bryobacteraceae bacterium]|nr:hypothetical protein [Bryobacteraceae bacterium]
DFEHPYDGASSAASFKSQYQKRFGKTALPTSSGGFCRIAPDTDLRLLVPNRLLSLTDVTVDAHGVASSSNSARGRSKRRSPRN